MEAGAQISEAGQRDRILTQWLETEYRAEEVNLPPVLAAILSARRPGQIILHVDGSGRIAVMIWKEKIKRVLTRTGNS